MDSRQLSPSLRTFMLLASLLLVPLLQLTDLLRPIERVLGDVMVTFVEPPSFDHVAVIAVDDASLGAIGRWPWSRSTHAEIIEQLSELGAERIGFDIVFADADSSDPNADLMLARAIGRSGRVVLAMLVDRSMTPGGPIAVLPFQPALAAAGGVGVAQIGADSSGIVRGIPADVMVDGMRWPTFARALVQGGRHAVAKSTASGLVGNGFHSRLPPARSLDRLVSVSAAELLSGTADPALLAGRIVLVGVTAPGVAESVTVADGLETRRLPTVIYQALAVAALDEGKLVSPVAWPVLAATLLAVAAVAWPLLIGLHVPAMLLSLATVPLVASVVLLTTDLLMPIAAPTLGVCFVCKAVWLYGHWRLHGSALSDRRKAHQALNTIADAVLTTDRSGIVDFSNRAAEQLFTRDDMSLYGLSLDQLLQAADQGAPKRDEAGQDLLCLVDRHGERRTLKAQRSPLHGDTRGGQLLALTDITVEQRLLEAIQHQALHDELTGLPNRMALERRMEALVAAAGQPQPYAGRFTVAHIGLDRFKAINDGLGHAAGDKLLKAIATRLRQTQCGAEMVARIGGDELAVLLACSDQPRARLQAFLSRLGAPLAVDGFEIHVRASVGVATFPDDGSGVAELLRHADNAMYKAKQAGGNDIVLHEATVGEDAMRRFWLDRELRQALLEHQLIMHYQPRFDVRDRSLTGFEALVRWRHSDRGMIAPGEFIPFAEESGLICDLGRQVVERTLAEMAATLGRHPNLRMSINTSVVQLKRDPGYVAFIAESMAKADLPPDQLEVEVTESLFLDPAFAGPGTQLRALADIGVQLSIDDFGTGYSSLAYLNRFPFSRIKIDRSFVQAIEVDESARAIVQAIVGLGDSLAKSTTAEGVENENQLIFLSRLGCQEAQGFLLGRPEPPERMHALM